MTVLPQSNQAASEAIDKFPHPLAFRSVTEDTILTVSNVVAPKVWEIEQRKDNARYIIARLKATGLGRFYSSYLKSYPIARALVIWTWRNGYQLYVKLLAAHPLNRRVWRWRKLVKLSVFAKTRDIPTVELVAAELVKTPAPKVFPLSDESYLVSPQEHYSLPPVFVAKISKGTIYGGTNLVLMGDEVICHDLYDFQRDYTSEELHGRNLIDPEKGRIRWLLHDDFPEFLPVAAVFVDACAVNYAHWLTEVLPRIAAFCREKKFEDVPVVVNEGLHKNIMESLFLVAGGERTIITLPIGRAIHIEELYLTSVAGYVPFERRNTKLAGHSHGKFNPGAFEVIRMQVSGFMEKLPDQAWPEKIYLRRNSGTRQITNTIELEELLIHQGYVIVEPEKLTFLQQIQLFRNAKEIISSTGAALSNTIFCNLGTNLGVLMAKHENMIYRYWLNMLSPLQVNVSYVLGEIVEKQELGIHGDFFIDSNNIYQLLKAWQTE